MSAKAVHIGRFADLAEHAQGEALMVADATYWPTCAIFVSIAEAQALLAAIPERRWPESTRVLRRELQTLVREGERTRP